ncbi:MAG: helix-turn-helix domain-containing protein [Candidatus Korobacteraceae bacterium]|jgi:excisionase family DNA binding protein
MKQAVSNSQSVAGREWFDLRGLTMYAAVSERTIREWLHRSLHPLPAVRVGTKILVRRSTFDAWLERHPLIPADSINVNETVNEILADMAAK